MEVISAMQKRCLCRRFVHKFPGVFHGWQCSHAVCLILSSGVSLLVIKNARQST